MNLTGPIREVLRTRRGLTDETLKRFRLGWDGDRVTNSQVYDEYNVLSNFRRYKWNSNETSTKYLTTQMNMGERIRGSTYLWFRQGFR